MNVLKNFAFFKDATASGESAVLNNPNRGSVLTVEVTGSGSFTLTVKGMVNVENDPPVYSNLAAINMATLSKSETITDPGIYAFGVDGVNGIKAELSGVSGTITVFGRIGE